MPSQNALRDIIYRDPVGTESLTGMQSATPIYDEKTSFENMLRARGLPPMEDMARIAMGFAGGVESPQYQSMADFIQLLRSLRTGLPSASGTPYLPKNVGVVGVTPIGQRMPATELFQTSPTQTGALGAIGRFGKEGIPYPQVARESDYSPIEDALDRLMSRIYGGWGEPGEGLTPYKPGGGR